MLCAWSPVSPWLSQTEKKKSRAFRKFVYRGIELEKLFDMPQAELVELFPARIRRRISRGLSRCVDVCSGCVQTHRGLSWLQGRWGW